MKRLIESAHVDELLTGLLGQGLRLVAPVRTGTRLSFQPVSTIAEIERQYTNTDLSPKEFLFPRTEAILEYFGGGSTLELRGLDPQVQETVLYGVRPCDAAGIARLRQVFAADVRDEFFLSRLDKTTVVSVSCTQPQPWCFCTAVGCGPASTEGSDLLLTAVGGTLFLVEILSPKGEAIVERYPGLFQGDTATDTRAVVAAVEARMTRNLELVGLGPRLRETFADERWERIGMACLGCGGCAYCCPTCHCFDLIEEGSPSSGRRLKTWDCCAFSDFTVHASGHNPRSQQAERYRQRVMHKLSYFPERFQRLMCVGCGRCVRNCPVGQDIYEAAVAMLTSTGGKG